MLSRCGSIRNTTVYLEPKARQGFSVEDSAFYTVNKVLPNLPQEAQEQRIDLPYPETRVSNEVLQTLNLQAYHGGPEHLNQSPAQARLENNLETTFRNRVVAIISGIYRAERRTALSEQDINEPRDSNFQDSATTMPTEQQPRRDRDDAREHSQIAQIGMPSVHNIMHVTNWTLWYSHDMTIWPPSQISNATHSWILCALISEAMFGSDGRFPYTRTNTFQQFTFKFDEDGPTICLPVIWSSWVVSVSNILQLLDPQLPHLPSLLHWSAFDQERILQHPNFQEEQSQIGILIMYLYQQATASRT